MSSATADVRSLVALLLESLNDRTLALNHQRKANKLVTLTRTFMWVGGDLPSLAPMAAGVSTAGAKRDAAYTCTRSLTGSPDAVFVGPRTTQRGISTVLFKGWLSEPCNCVCSSTR